MLSHANKSWRYNNLETMASKKTQGKKTKKTTSKKSTKGKKNLKKAKKQGPILKDKQVLSWGAVALIITFLCYIPAINNGFVNWDDPDYVEDNVLIHQINGENIQAIFTEPIAENYHPLTFI